MKIPHARQGRSFLKSTKCDCYEIKRSLICLKLEFSLMNSNTLKNKSALADEIRTIRKVSREIRIKLGVLDLCQDLYLQKNHKINESVTLRHSKIQHLSLIEDGTIILFQILY